MSPSEVMGATTGFSPARAKTWPTIGSEHFTVHERGGTRAEVTEGTEGSFPGPEFKKSFKEPLKSDGVRLGRHGPNVRQDAVAESASARRRAMPRSDARRRRKRLAIRQSIGQGRDDE